MQHSEQWLDDGNRFRSHRLRDLPGNRTATPQTDPNTPVCPSGLPVANQNYNAMLNLAAMQSGQMVSGYILTPGAVVLGLTPANTAVVTPSLQNTYAFEKLISTGQIQIAQSPPDWQFAPAWSISMALSILSGKASSISASTTCS